jgi:DNA-directed RNA polymerase subunit RPC12/RpoP
MRPDDDSQILYLCPYCPAPLKLKKYGPISYSTSYSKSMSVMEELEVEIEELEKQACAACTRCGTKPANPVPTFDDMPLLNALEADILDLEMRARADCEYCGAVRESIFSHK